MNNLHLQSCLFFDVCDHLRISYLADIFVFEHAYKVTSHIREYAIF